MKIKDGVLFERDGKELHSCILWAQWKISSLMESTGEFTITALLDGDHMVGSFHYEGLAMDVRSRHMEMPKQIEVLAQIKALVGDHYDCIIESGTQPHFHIEVSPVWVRENGDPRIKA